MAYRPYLAFGGNCREAFSTDDRSGFGTPWMVMADMPAT
jgi:hypothetical protein